MGMENKLFYAVIVMRDGSNEYKLDNLYLIAETMEEADNYMYFTYMVNFFGEDTKYEDGWWTDFLRAARYGLFKVGIELVAALNIHTGKNESYAKTLTKIGDE